MEKIIKQSARRDAVPEATKAAELLKVALDFEEDMVFGMLLHDRDDNTPLEKYISHDKAWKNIK